jgi:murein hydrolase activator
MALLAATAGAAETDPVRENAAQLDKLRGRIHALQESLDSDRSRKDELSSQLEDAERRYAGLSAELAGLRRQINAQAAQRRRTEAARADAEKDVARHRRALAQQLRAYYIIGQRGETKLVLNQDGSQRLTRVLTYYDYLNRARVERIRLIQEQAEKLAALAVQLKQETAVLQETRSRQQGTLTALEAVRAEREETMQALASRIAGEEGELKQLKSDEKDLSRLIDELRAALADVPADLGKPFNRLRGQLPWPLRGKLLAKFGEPKAGGRLKWNGLWIAGSEGDPVKAIARGRVAYVGWMHAYGLIAVLEHEGGYYSLYGHNQNVAVSVGDWVQAGDPIATVGATGGHARSGLYFELRKGTDAINPRPWLKARGRA